MRKFVVSVLVCVLLTSGVLASASVINNNSEMNGEISVVIPVGDYKIENTGQGNYVSADGFGQLLVPGKPNLPSKIFSIAIPPGAKVVDIVYETKDTVISGFYNVLPSTLPRVIGKEDPAIYAQEQNRYTENYKSVYENNNPYPASVAEIVGTGGYRKYNLVDVRVNPLTYYPISGELIYHSTISVSVRYTISKDFSSKDIMIDNLPQTEKIAKEIVLNYDQAKDWYPIGPSGRDSYDYVIITTDALVSSVDPLADWESAKGRNVNVVTTSWISDNYVGYDLAAKMRAFLLEKYPSGAWGILDVCLVGDYNGVPMRHTVQDVGYGPTETDYYYAELSLPDSESWDHDGDHQYGEDSDPIDFQAEISVGRIPWNDASIVQSICEKSIAYEQNTEESFKKNILLLGAFFWSDTDNAVLMEAKVDQEWMTDWTMTRMYEDAQSSHPCDYDLTYNNVKSIWSAGTYAFVDWAGHGSESAAYEYYPSQPFVDEVTCTFLNDNYPAIIFADSCSNSDTDYLNIGQAMMAQGGIGFLGANKVAFGCPGWNNPMSGSSQSLDYFFTTCCTSGEYTQGEALQWSLRQMYTNNLWDYMRYEMFEWGSIWGNPDLTMGPVTTSDPPSIPTITGPTRGVINTVYTFSTAATDPNGDQVYYWFDWGDGSNSGWLGPYTSGLTIASTHSWSELGTYYVKVKAKDVNGATSDWSEILTLDIILDNAPNTPSIEGKTSGKPGTSYLYRFVTTDVDGDSVYYYIDWVDGTNSGWLGPYNSGQQASTTHSWSTQGTYNVKIKAKDTPGEESDWATLQVVMPRNRMIQNSFLLGLLERFPHAFPILRHLLNPN
jgi:hypothetical protein